jgi:hypothetical protein
MQRFRDPLLRAAFDLQSRLYSIVQLGFLRKYYYRSEADSLYAVQSTLYVIAEFLGWVEALRREIQFLDLGDVAASRRLSELLQHVSQAFLTDTIDLTFRLFRGEQRAIGELMLSPRPAADPVRYECIGVVAFIEKLADPPFLRWFEKLQRDIEKLATELSNKSEERLVLLQHALIDVIDFLDSDGVRLPKEYRQKICTRPGRQF